MSKDLFGSLIAAGVAAMLMFQVFVNVGMTIGIMPITGVTLPLMSYGGSSVITTLLAVGLLQVNLRAGARLSCTEGPRACATRANASRATCSRRQALHDVAHAGLAPAARIRAGSCVVGRAPSCSALHPSKDWITLKKQVLVSVDRAETRVALLEASGTPAAARILRRSRSAQARARLRRGRLPRS